MELPPLLKLDSVQEYKQHYERHYLRGKIITFDGIRVYFRPQTFGHAFYKNSKGVSGDKDAFAPERAERMDWVKATLESAEAEIFMGWIKATKTYDENRRVSVIFEGFVVVIELSLTRKGELKGNFITCYLADNSIDRIRKSPEWDYEKCIEKLKK